MKQNPKRGNLKPFTWGLALTAAGMITALAVGDMISFTAGTPIKSADVNTNFQVLRNAVVALEAGKQARISGTCATGSSIRVVNADGTVTCQAAGTAGTTYTAGAGLALSGNAFSVANGGITSAMLADGSVSAAKLASGAVTSTKFALPINISASRGNLSPRGLLTVTNTDTSLIGPYNYATAIHGVQGTGINLNYQGAGVWGDGENTLGVLATSKSNTALLAHSETGMGLMVSTSSGSLAGEFTGNVQINGNLSVTGTVSKGGGSFKIDSPTDPQNKYLYHSFVESPDMMNVYNGNVILDSRGEAWVTLPSYFEALNGEYRYQLTAIGAPGPNLYVADEIQGNRFRIAGGQPQSKVSWQVTGVRHDPYANAHRIPTEVMKPVAQRGKYLYPDAYGQPKNLGESYASTPHDTLK